MPYMKQLDSLRGIAVLLVVLSHWLPNSSFQWGAFLGVNTFFVLSGFLISSILFLNKEEAEVAGYSKLVVLKNFFFRRALRIFPIYFFVVITLYVLGEDSVPAINYDIKYLLTFTINFHIFLVKHYGKYTAHFWSLAVEEQFYFMWPWLMLFLRRKYLLVAILFIILTGSISEIFIRDPFEYILTYNCFNAFGVGALLAWVYIYRPQFLKKTFPLLSYLILTEFGIIFLMLFGWLPSIFPLRTLLSPMAIWIISYVILNLNSGKKLKFSFILNNSQLIFIGKISYGVYLYHIYIPYITANFLYYLENTLQNSLKPYAFLLYFLSNFCITILLSRLSWRFVEIPTMRFKRYFEYQKPDSSSASEKFTYRTF